MMLKTIFRTGTFILFFFSAVLVNAQTRTDWFQEAKYGMFIHWGLYSAAEGMWKGEKLRYLNNYAEWIRYRNRISKEEYGKLASRFIWDRINPEEWVVLAKEAGMKYIIITSKHHDGVALWDTKVGNYSLTKLSGSNRDMIKEIADACRKHDMKLGFYYSHWIDWEHPYAWDHNQELKGHVTDAQFNQYWQEKAIPQLRELLTNYGDIAMMWFDMWIPYEQTIFKKEQLEQAVALIRELQPKCLINSRLGLPTDAQYVDFETLGDNQFSTRYIEHPWETPGTIAHSWGYNGQETDWKSTSQLFKSLISNVSLNGGLTLNIGPRADGSLPYESISRLQDLGKWLKNYGNGIYGSTGLQLRSDQHDWGYLTSKQQDGKTTLFAHVFNWPLDNVLRISGVTSQVTAAYVSDQKQKKELKFEQKGSLLHIYTPHEQPEPHVSTITLVVENSLELDKEMVAESTFGGFSLQPKNSLTSDLTIKRYNGKNPTYAIIDQAKPLIWKIYIPEAGEYAVDLSAHNPNSGNVSLHILVDNKELSSQISPSDKMVVEPNQNNYTEEFTEHRMGTINFEKPGYYEVKLKSDTNLQIWFNWIWIDKM